MAEQQTFQIFSLDITGFRKTFLQITMYLKEKKMDLKTMVVNIFEENTPA